MPPLVPNTLRSVKVVRYPRLFRAMQIPLNIVTRRLFSGTDCGRAPHVKMLRQVKLF
jgi:hypothetical protein